MGPGWRRGGVLLTSHFLRQGWQTDEEAEHFDIPQPRFTFMPFVGPVPHNARARPQRWADIPRE